MAGLGLALEGGGARGGAHVGVLRALQEERIPISSIAGTSAGSVCAAAYALHGNVQDAKAALDQAMKIGVRLLDINFSGILGSVVHLITRHGKQAMGLFKGNRLLRWTDAFTHGNAMAKTAIPLVIPAVDLVSGKIYAFSSKAPRSLGDYHWDTVAQIAQAVRGSCSIPGVFCPLAYGKALLVDGGTLENLPVRVLRRQGSDRVVGVNLYVQGEDAEDRPDDILGVGLRVMKIVAPYLEKRDERAADFILQVTLPKDSGLFSMHKLAAYEAIGYDAAKAAMPRIREVLSRVPNPRVTPQYDKIRP